MAGKGPPIPGVIAKDTIGFGDDVPPLNIVKIGSVGVARLDVLPLELRPQLPHLGIAKRHHLVLTLRDITIVREGSGTGEGKAPTPGQAHELALKGAETDATKRALATFGNPFGLALYDREQLGVRKARTHKPSPPIGPWVLHSPAGAEEASFDQPSEFAGALRKAMSEANDIELLFAIWEQNVETVRALNRSLKREQLPKSGIAPQLVNHLKQCAIALVKPESRANGSGHPNVPGSPTKVGPHQDRQERPHLWRTKAHTL